MLENAFPRLSGTRYRITSPDDRIYNCIAWAAEEETRWWFWPPEYYWPSAASRGSDISCLVAAFRALRYEVCENSGLESRYQKVALYVREGNCTHVARQLFNGLWTSKLGQDVDVKARECDVPETSPWRQSSVRCNCSGVPTGATLVAFYWLTRSLRVESDTLP